MGESKLENMVITKENGDEKAVERTYHNTYVFKIKCPSVGPTVEISYDLAVLKYCIKYCENSRIFHPIIYILACRVGLFIGRYVKTDSNAIENLYPYSDGNMQITKQKILDLIMA